METVENNIQELIDNYSDYAYTLNVLTDDIEEYIADPRNEVEKGLKGESQNVFNAVLQTIYYSRIKAVLDSTAEQPRKEYNPYIINNLCNVYISLCSRYNKEINIYGYMYLTNVSYTTIKRWYTDYYDNSTQCINTISELDIYNTDRHTVTAVRASIYKRLLDAREDSLSNMLTSGKNPVGTIAILNHAYHWATDNAIHEEKQRAITLSQLPKLELSDNGKQ